MFDATVFVVHKGVTRVGPGDDELVEARGYSTEGLFEEGQGNKPASSQSKTVPTYPTETA